MVISANVKKIINDKGLKQKYIAQKAGYTMKRFNALLNGRLIMRPDDILKISVALDVSPNELFGITSEKIRKEN